MVVELTMTVDLRPVGDLKKYTWCTSMVRLSEGCRSVVAKRVVPQMLIFH